MPFVPMAALLEEARAGGYAVPSFCVWCPETMLTVLRVAADLRAPVILMNGPCEFPLVTPREHGAVAHALIPGFDVSAALHLDHGDLAERAEACLSAGYTSIMLDYSTRPLAENIAAMRQVVAAMRPHGVTVEGEIGVVGKVDDTVAEGGEVADLTDPEEAADYVGQTGVDALAVAIGNAHGAYTHLPQLDFERLAQLRDAVSVPLVLHGGSGTPADDLRRAISLGIAKVNIATELMTATRTSLTAQWGREEKPWMPDTMAVAMEAMSVVVEKWIHLTGAGGRR